MASIHHRQDNEADTQIVDPPVENAVERASVPQFLSRLLLPATIPPTNPVTLGILNTAAIADSSASSSTTIRTGRSRALSLPHDVSFSSELDLVKSSESLTHSLLHLARDATGHVVDGSGSGHEDGPISRWLDWQVILYRPQSSQVVLYHPQDGKIITKRFPKRLMEALASSSTSRSRCALCRQLLPPSTYQQPTPTTSLDEFEQDPLSSFYLDEAYFQLLLSRQSRQQSERQGPEIEIDDNEQEDENEQSPNNAVPTEPRESTPTPSLNSSADTHHHIPPSLLNPDYYSRFFIELRKLGRGYRGSVYLCQHVLDHVILGEFAVKKVRVGDNTEWLDRMLREVYVIQRIKSKQTIGYRHCWVEWHRDLRFGPEVPTLFILMDFANGGNLQEWVEIQFDEREGNAADVKPLSKRERIKRKLGQDFVHTKANEADDAGTVYARKHGGIGKSLDGSGRRVRYLTEDQIWNLFLQIVTGLRDVHACGVVYRDMKPSNLLLQFQNPSDPDETPRVLLSDFGECEIISEIHDRSRTGNTGTMEFMAPELLQTDPETGGFLNTVEIYSPTTDLWSLGMILYYLCYSSLPYTNIEDVTLLRTEVLSFEGLTFSPDSRVSMPLQNLITRLLSRDASKRPSAQQILDEWSWKLETSASPSSSKPTSSEPSPIPTTSHATMQATPIVTTRELETEEIKIFDSSQELTQTTAVLRRRHRHPSTPELRLPTNAPSITEVDSNSSLSRKKSLEIVKYLPSPLVTTQNFAIATQTERTPPANLLRVAIMTLQILIFVAIQAWKRAAWNMTGMLGFAVVTGLAGFSIVESPRVFSRKFWTLTLAYALLIILYITVL